MHVKIFTEDIDNQQRSCNQINDRDVDEQTSKNTRQLLALGEKKIRAGKEESSIHETS